jgi:uncharacterized protein YndB with AHSA1/START domain
MAAERNESGRNGSGAAREADSGYALTITRTLNVPRALAFEVWTSPEHLVRWWGPRDQAGRDFTTPVCEVDFRPGGAYHICIRSPQGEDHWQRGVYREIVEPERIVFTFAWERDGNVERDTLVEVTFEEAGPERTLLTFRQSGLESEESRDGHRIGWTQLVDRLEARLADIVAERGAQRAD